MNQSRLKQLLWMVALWGPACWRWGQSVCFSLLMTAAGLKV
ncbi:DUF2474 domain-containing protein [Raoultella planticola]|nr:DUF2474 domain-containing protein [Raoultella planticola]